MLRPPQASRFISRMDPISLLLVILTCALICTLLSPVFFLVLYKQASALTQRCEDTNQFVNIFTRQLAEYEQNLLVWQMENKTLKKDITNLKRRLQALENRDRTYSLRPKLSRTRTLTIQDGSSVTQTQSLG